MAKVDTDYIRRAERITSFNIETKDFETLCYKREIQTLIQKHFFPNFNLRTLLKKVDKARLNEKIEILRQHDPELFTKLHHYNLKGVGPGEVTLFFLVNDVYLGGGSSSGADIICKDLSYEIKAVHVSKEGLAHNFKLGGTVSLSNIMVELYDLVSYYKLDGSETEIKKSTVNILRDNYYDDFRPIEEKFADAAHEYFRNHEVIFINNSLSKQKVGRIEAIKRVHRDDIFIERLTNGTVKPMIKL